MSNGINLRQNEDTSIAMLAAQRKLYNEVGYFDLLYTTLLVLLPLFFALAQELGTAWSWIKISSYMLSFLTIFVSIFIQKASGKRKSLAATIQLAFDIYVFNMPWDNKLFGSQKNLNETIIKKSKKILDDENERQLLLNWYTPEVENMTLEKGIFTCQKENYLWDVGLRKRYRLFAILAISAIVVTIFLIGFIKNEPIQEWFMRFILVLPMVKWLVNLISGLNSDLERLKELDYEFCRIDIRSMEDLQSIEKRITDHRKKTVKIPNYIYKIFKNNDEDNMLLIASFDARQK